MAKKYLDDTGMSYFWGKLKAYFQEKLVVESGSVTGITALRSGNVVTLSINKSVSASSAGWVSLGVIGERFRPPAYRYASCYNNDDTSYNAMRPIQTRVGSNGSVDVYLYSDKLSVTARGTITYVVGS